MLDDAMEHVIGSEVYIDTSMAAMYYSDVRCRQAILAHDPDRVLFGSDSPWDDQATAARIVPPEAAWRSAGGTGPLGQRRPPAPAGRGSPAGANGRSFCVTEKKRAVPPSAERHILLSA